MASILLQTTIQYKEDAWHIRRFNMLRRQLERSGFHVVARDWTPMEDGNDAILSNLDESEFDQLWLFCVDEGEGLGPKDAEGIIRFWEKGRGVLLTRDHHDLGCSIMKLGRLGVGHCFHNHRPESNKARRMNDDENTQDIEWPNYHSGDNGDTQMIHPTEPVHWVFLHSDGSIMRRFPAHPHEGAVEVPDSHPHGRVLAVGTSKLTGRPFNLVVAFEQDGEGRGRVICESSFHHFADYNWNPNAGAPSFVEEGTSNMVKTHKHLLNDVKAYVANVAKWLAEPVKSEAA